MTIPPAPWHIPQPYDETNPAPWCVECREYLVRTAGQLCPVCRDESKETP